MIYAFEEIKEKAPSKLSSIFVYFEKFYIGKKCRFKNSDVRKVPSYPIKMWNVHNRVLNEQMILEQIIRSNLGTNNSL